MNFEQELLSFRPHLLRWARGYRSSDGVEDLVQDVLVKALRSREKFLPETNMRSWLAVMMRHLAFSEGRRSWRSVGMPEGLAESVLCAPAQHEHLELRELLDRIGELRPKEQELLLELGLHDGSSAEIARSYGMNPNTARTRVTRARAALSKRYEEVVHEA